MGIANVSMDVWNDVGAAKHERGWRVKPRDAEENLTALSQGLFSSMYHPATETPSHCTLGTQDPV